MSIPPSKAKLFVFYPNDYTVEIEMEDERKTLVFQGQRNYLTAKTASYDSSQDKKFERTISLEMIPGRSISVVVGGKVSAKEAKKGEKPPPLTK
jgi:hypothetical protein